VKNPDDFDELLNEAVSEYRDAEPLAGMEERVLTRLQASEPARKGLGWRWVVAISCAATVVVAVWSGAARRTPQTAAPAEIASGATVESALPSTAPMQAIAPTPKSSEIHRHATRSSPVATPTESAAKTKLAVFPSPTPLTPEERAFMAVLQMSPDAMAAASPPDAPVTIAEIEIKPLQDTNPRPGEDQ